MPKQANVALTRAENLFIVVGNPECMWEDPMWRQWVSKHWHYKSNKVMFHNKNLICVPFLQILHSYYFAIGMVCGTGNAWERTQLIQVCSTMQSLCLCSNKWKRKVTPQIPLSLAQWRKSIECTQALLKIHLFRNRVTCLLIIN